MVCMNIYLLIHTDAACLNCLEALVGTSDRSDGIVLTDLVMEREYQQIDEESLFEAIKIIDWHLRKSIDTNDFGSNIDELRTLTLSELDAKSGRESGQRKRWWGRWRERQCLSQRSPSTSRDVMVNALIRLLRLDHVDETAYACKYFVTEELSECNRASKDSIGRRVRNGTHLLPRIDDIIFETARRRADFCLPYYQRELRSISRLSDQSFALVHEFWNRILEHRFEAAQLDVDRLGEQDWMRALAHIERMPLAIEEGEVEIVKQVLDAMHARRLSEPREGQVRTMQHEAFLVIPCSSFIDKVRETIESLDFDLQLGRFIAPRSMDAVLKDEQIHRVRAYYSICRKVVDHAERTLKLIASGEQ